MSVSFDVVLDRVYVVEQALAGAITDAIRKIGFDVEAKAKVKITEQNAIDTGAARASIHTAYQGGGNYGKASSEATAAASRPGAKSGKPHAFRMLPEEVPEEAASLYVAVGAEYGANIAYGRGEGENARPFLGPAAEEVFAAADQVVGRMIDQKID